MRSARNSSTSLKDALPDVRILLNGLWKYSGWLVGHTLVGYKLFVSCTFSVNTFSRPTHANAELSHASHMSLVELAALKHFMCSRWLIPYTSLVVTRI